MEIFRNVLIGFWILSVVIFIVFVGYSLKHILTSEVEAKTEIEDRFIKIQDWNNNFVVYDKETKVQYFVFSGGITVLVDQNGKPLLYEGE